MPEDSEGSVPDQLSSISESVTLPYEELKELTAAAHLSVMPKIPVLSFFSRHELFTPNHCFQNFTGLMFTGCDEVKGLEEADVCKKGQTGACCNASDEVMQVSNLPTRALQVTIYSLHPVATVFDKRAFSLFAAARDGR